MRIEAIRRTLEDAEGCLRLPFDDPHAPDRRPDLDDELRLGVVEIDGRGLGDLEAEGVARPVGSGLAVAALDLLLVDDLVGDAGDLGLRPVRRLRIDRGTV